MARQRVSPGASWGCVLVWDGLADFSSTAASASQGPDSASDSRDAGPGAAAGARGSGWDGRIEPGWDDVLVYLRLLVDTDPALRSRTTLVRAGPSFLLFRPPPPPQA